MAEKRTAKKTTKAPAKKSTRSSNASVSFTAEERAAMKEYAAELKTAARRGKGASKGDGEGDVLAKIKEMPDADRVIAERVHVIVKATAPDLESRTWYGMPAYAKDGKVLCFFQSAAKFKARYGTLGFSDVANLDDGTMWPTAFALKDMTPATEKQIAALIKQAVS